VRIEEIGFGVVHRPVTDDELFPILVACGECEGAGVVVEVTKPSGLYRRDVPCPSCAGSGHDPKVRAMLVRMLIDVDVEMLREAVKMGEHHNDWMEITAGAEDALEVLVANARAVLDVLGGSDE
jgi:hypothetical protein